MSVIKTLSKFIEDGKSLIKCGNSKCKHHDVSKNRFCSQWTAREKCGFFDVGDKIVETNEYMGTQYCMANVPDADSTPKDTMWDRFDKVWSLKLPEDGPEAEDLGFDMPSSDDMVNAPPHYQFTNELEVIDVIKIALEKNLREQGPVESYLYSQVLKYLLRCGCKDNMEEDLLKAEFYLKDLVNEIQAEFGKFETKRVDLYTTCPNSSDTGETDEDI